ncbi:MAG: hypothetical protein MUC95_00145 [Spirochaetes bacterium]|nr:hypothetical protein [Spirochaetota bacterium]
MEFLLLVLVNIVMATIFYLVIRLKLEKTASGYREKKLKREIDEIISEFNEVAERNISILENRIASMKKLMEKTGDVKSIDIQISDNINVIKEKISESGINGVKKAAEKPPVPEREREEMISYNNSERDLKFIVNDYIVIARRIFASMKNIIMKKYHYYKKSLTNSIAEFAAAIENGQVNQKTEAPAAGIEETVRDMEKTAEIAGELKHKAAEKKNAIVKELPADLPPLLSEHEICEMFGKTKDKYLLISELFHKGYSAKVLTKCSGIPMGEVKLVLDLNG